MSYSKQCKTASSSSKKGPKTKKSPQHKAAESKFLAIKNEGLLAVANSYRKERELKEHSIQFDAPTHALGKNAEAMFYYVQSVAGREYLTSLHDTVISASSMPFKTVASQNDIQKLLLLATRTWRQRIGVHSNVLPKTRESFLKSAPTITVRKMHSFSSHSAP